MVDAADDDRVTRLHEHLVGVGEEVDFSAHAAEAVQGVGAVPLDLVMDPPLRVGETIDFTMEGVFPKYRYATAAKLREATRGTAIGERPFDYIAWMIDCPTRLLKITIDLPKDAGIELLGPLSSYHDYDFPKPQVQSRICMKSIPAAKWSSPARPTCGCNSLLRKRSETATTDLLGGCRSLS